MRGIVSWGAYLPYRRLDRSQITAFLGQGGGRGTRTVASYDEDATTMGVEASRLALKATDASPDSVVFATVATPYVDKTNATTVHAALRLPDSVPAFDLGASVRSAAGGLRFALAGAGTTLLVTGDMRTGLAGSADEAAGGDAAAALVLGEGAGVVAEYLGGASATQEFLDRWRAAGEIRSKVWDDKFSELTYVGLGRQAFKEGLASAGLAPADVDVVAVAAPTARIGKAMAGKLGVERVAPDLTDVVGATGAAQPGVLLAGMLEAAEPGQVLALVVLADGAEVFFFRTTAALASFTATRPLAGQLEGGAPVTYNRFLSWRGMIDIEPPRRPEPARVSASAAGRSVDWKYGFVGSRDRETGALHLPPARVSFEGGNVDDMEPAPMSAATGTVVTFTVDRLAYSPSPPVIFAVVDFDGGGRLPIELTDTTPDGVGVGTRVEMTFRRLNSADGIANYFWKARPVR